MNHLEIERQKDQEGFTPVSLNLGGSDVHTKTGIMFVPKNYKHDVVYNVEYYTQATDGSLYNPRMTKAIEHDGALFGWGNGRWFVSGDIYSEKYAGKFIRVYNAEYWQNGDRIETYQA